MTRVFMGDVMRKRQRLWLSYLAAQRASRRALKRNDTKAMAKWIREMDRRYLLWDKAPMFVLLWALYRRGKRFDVCPWPP